MRNLRQRAPRSRNAAACCLESLESRTLFSVSITTRFGSELVITGTTGNNSVDVAQSASAITITADGQTYNAALPSAGIFIYTRGGSDSVTVQSSVTLRTTVDAIDGTASSITTSGTNVSVWMDSTDTESGAAAGIHRVASFAGGVSKALNVALANPKDSRSVFTVNNRSLWGGGPDVNDANQGSVGDCWFIASIAGLANSSPARLEESAVDLGDGTYAVEFFRNNAPTYVRVSNQFSTGPFNGYRYAQPSVNGAIWAPVLEKALCYFRSAKNTYNSISGGYGSEGLGYFNVSSSTTAPKSYTDASLFSMVSASLAAGKTVVFGTPTNAPNLVGNHEYTIISCYSDASGTHYLVRNPWGVSGDSLENSLGYATISFSQLVANSSEITRAV